MRVASTNVPAFTRIGLALSWAVIRSNRTLSNSNATSALRKRTKAVRSGVGSDDENPQKRRNEERSSSASASFTSDRSYQTASSIALNSASGGQAGSPFAALLTSFNAASTGDQSINLASSSSGELRPTRPCELNRKLSWPIRRRAIARSPNQESATTESSNVAPSNTRAQVS